jgi:putative hemolysin
MNRSIKILLLVGLIAVVGALLVGIMGLAALLPFRSSIQATTQSELNSAAPSDVGLANPASVHCVEQGYTVQILEAEDGSQSGVCIFPDGSQCDEWAFFRGECGPSSGD